jgi:agmatinase
MPAGTASAARDLHSLRLAWSSYRFIGILDIGKEQTFLSGIRILDAGDVDVLLEPAETRERTTAHAGSIIDRGLLLASIGGDHSVSFPLIAAFEKYDPLTVVLLDAHLGCRDTSLNMKFSNNSPFRRAHELPFVKRIITAGVRGIKSKARKYRESLAHGNLVFPMEQIYEQGIAPILKEIGELGNYNVSLDIDGLDPSIAPGTESPEANGLSFRQARQLLRGLTYHGRLVGTDIVEVNPYLDHSELIQHISVQLLEAIASGFPCKSRWRYTLCKLATLGSGANCETDGKRHSPGESIGSV